MFSRTQEKPMLYLAIYLPLASVRTYYSLTDRGLRNRGNLNPRLKGTIHPYMQARIISFDYMLITKGKGALLDATADFV